MDELVDVASVWMVSEKRREEREQEVGRAWLAVLAEGDIDKIGRMIADLADRSASLDYEVLTKLQRSASAHMHKVTQAAFHQVVRRRSNRSCSCGCDPCEGEEAAVRTEPH